MRLHGKGLVDFNQSDNNQKTGFMWACREGKLAAVKAMLEHGKDLVDFNKPNHHK